MRDLAPDIYRQRMIIEGRVVVSEVAAKEVIEILDKLCDDLQMEKLTGPTASYCEEYGWCGWMHWKTSGVHMYVWNEKRSNFFSIDIYTCKPFSCETAINTVKKYFGNHLQDIEWKEV